MTDTPTNNYHFMKPEVGASADDWGWVWNDNLDSIDTQLKAVSVVADDALAAADASLKTANNLSEINDEAKRAAARANLGLAIGTNVQGYHMNLAALAGLNGAAGKTPYFTDGGAMAMGDSTNFGRSLWNAPSAAAACSTLGLGNVTNLPIYVQSGDPGSAATGALWIW